MSDLVFIGKAVPSRWGGTTCKVCTEAIDAGMLIVKVAGEGKTTAHGQGPGYWVHAKHDTRNHQDSLFG